jgi:death-on-curing protein
VNYCLAVAAVLEIHAELPDGGPLINRNALESALARPMQEPFNIIAYPTLMEKAAALLDGLARAHAFLNGNKRIAWICCVMYLEAHQVELAPIPATEVAEFVVSVVVNKYSIIEIVEWLLEHSA